MQTLLIEPEVAVAIHGSIAVSSINGKLTAPLVQKISDVCVGHRRDYAGREISLTLTREGVLLPDEGARKLIQEMNLRGDAAQVSVVVVDGGGFWAAAARGVIASMSLFSKTAPSAAKTVADALDQLRPHLENDPACRDLVALEKELVAFRQAHIAAPSAHCRSPRSHG
ncbi:MAG TPA: hypothetical protein VGO62_07370 [Myxococcota bacterium]|jgi:accessory colonization factor AcfC